MASVEHLGGNKYKIYVELGYDDYGKRRRRTKTVTATSNRDLRKKELEFELKVMQDIEKEEMELENIAFEAFFDRWWTTHVEVNLSISTRNSYHYFIPFLKEHFGDLKMRKISRLHIDEFFNKERAAGRKSLGTKLTMLKGIFSKSVEWEVREHSPMDKYKLQGNMPPVEREVYDASELRELYDLLETLKERDRLMILAASLGGLRRGEVLGIGRDSPNYKENYILIERSLNFDREKKEKYIGPTKARNIRKVFYPEKFMHELKLYDFKLNELRDRYGDRWELIDGIDLIFRTSTGKIMHPQSFTNLWNTIRKKLDLKDIVLHDLRHSAATYLINDGMDMKKVQTMLGHKNLTTTLNTYTHAVKDNEDASIKSFEKLL